MDFNVQTVMLAENELIIGVDAKLFGTLKSVYTNFQFLIATRSH